MDLRGKFAPGELLRMLNLLQETRRGFSKNADGRIGMELCLMQLCQPKLTLDLQTVNARLSKLEEQLASGAFTVKAAAKPADADDEERPPFPDDADDPFARVSRCRTHRRMRQRPKNQKRRSRSASGRSWHGRSRRG